MVGPVLQLDCVLVSLCVDLFTLITQIKGGVHTETRGSPGSFRPVDMDQKP